MDENTKRVMFSTGAEEWETPNELFRWLDSAFHFTLDVCASSTNAKVKTYYDKQSDAFTVGWKGVCYMNPPYGREIGKWVKYAYEQSRDPNTTVVCLLPARTDTKWFHNYCVEGGQIIFLKGRIRFVGAEAGAPFPSMIVVFKRYPNSQQIEDLGAKPLECWTR